jgi:hypothetical protein
MSEQLQNFIPQLVGYRETLDQIFSKPSKTPNDLQRYFFDLLVCTSQLYLDHLFVLKDSPSVRNQANKNLPPETSRSRYQSRNESARKISSSIGVIASLEALHSRESIF